MADLRIERGHFFFYGIDCLPGLAQVLGGAVQQAVIVHAFIFEEGYAQPINVDRDYLPDRVEPAQFSSNLVKVTASRHKWGENLHLFARVDAGSVSAGEFGKAVQQGIHLPRRLAILQHILADKQVEVLDLFQ